MPTAYLAPSAAALTSSAAALEYARLLLRLHELFCQGKEEGEEPDAIRDQMEAPWYRMTPSEQERMRACPRISTPLPRAARRRLPWTTKSFKYGRTKLRSARANICKAMLTRGSRSGASRGRAIFRRRMAIPLPLFIFCRQGAGTSSGITRPPPFL